jgi:nicotinamidase-related amidase
MTHVADTIPYPWPFDGAAHPVRDADHLAVVVCGAQRHWLDMVGCASPGAERAVGALLVLIDELRVRGALVVWIRNGATTARTRPIDRTLPVVGSEEWELLGVPHPSDLVIDTPGHDGFAVAWLDDELRARGVDRLALAGVGTEIAVSATNRSANDRGYECLTLTDAVVHHDATTGAAALSSICMSGGIFGAIGTGDALLSALDPDTSSPDTTDDERRDRGGSQR